jgi:predicted phosphohydrolase
MSLWAIADIHASRRDPDTGLLSKPMDVFGAHWADHMERLERAWHRLVSEEDTVIVAGDIDWGLRMEEAMETMHWLADLPGKKILLRGNHDYWWSSKATNRVRRTLPPGIEALHNNCLQADGFNVCGTKGSPVPGGIDWTPENAKMLNREQLRLCMSLDARDPSLPTVVAIHYPPFYPSQSTSPYREILERYHVCACVYGHLHGGAAGAGPEGCYGGVEYRLVAGDAIDFAPVLVGAAGRLALQTSREHRKGDEMDERDESGDDLGELARRAMADKLGETGSEERAQELYDVPTENAAELAEQQADERQG